LPKAIKHAADAGFDAVECHWPYEHNAADVKAALADAGINMVSLNTVPGDLSAGEFGFTACPGREPEARAAIKQAIEYAVRVGAKNIHVMAGAASGNEAHMTYVSNLRIACELASSTNITLLIEPVNQGDAPGYFMSDIHLAAEVISDVGTSNLQLMFDCYHIEKLHGNVTELFEKYFPIIGHVQMAAVPDRGEPDRGDLDYMQVLGSIREIGFKGPIGAEYRPRTTVEDGLSWLAKFNSI